MAEDVVLVSEASSRLETIPATYGTEKETIMTKEAEQVWRVDLPRTSPPASTELLASARAGNAELDSATPGMCFHEHFVPAKYSTEPQEVLVNQATNKVGVTAAKYRTVEKSILVKEASFRMEEVPAQYRWEEEQVTDKPAHTVWKKGTGPIQQIDSATGEIMCLVDIPATFKTVRKKVLASPATTRRIEIPAEYKTVSVKELAEKAGESNMEIPAVYSSINITKKVSDAQFVWHEVHNLEHPKKTRTGLKVCLTETPAQFKTITRQVVASPAATRSVEIPAVHKTIKVRKLVEEAKEVRTPIPEQYKKFTHQELAKEGFMEWRSILCETNMTKSRITAIQRALDDAGYNPGPIDGVIGAETIAAANAFQRSKGLPVDRYLNLSTLNALGVSPR